MIDPTLVNDEVGVWRDVSTKKRWGVQQAKKKKKDLQAYKQAKNVMKGRKVGKDILEARWTPHLMYGERELYSRYPDFPRKQGRYFDILVAVPSNTSLCPETMPQVDPLNFVYLCWWKCSKIHSMHVSTYIFIVKICELLLPSDSDRQLLALVLPKPKASDR